MKPTKKVMIVDDEEVFRVGLKSCVDWGKFGFEVVCDACNGEEAIQKFDIYHPDIVFTDIVMPQKNGVELVEYIINKNAETTIIVLSCHNDFEYVKQTLKMGAYDYLLKLSIKVDDFETYLQALQQKCFEDETRNLEQEQKQEVFQSHLEYLKEKYLLKILLGEISPTKQEFEERKKEYGLSISFDHLFLTIFSCLSVGSNSKIRNLSEKIKPFMSMQARTGESFHYQGKTILLLQVESMQDGSYFLKHFERFLRKEAEPDETIYIAGGSCSSLFAIPEISEAFQQCKKAYGKAFIFSSGFVLYKPEKDQMPRDSFPFLETQQKFIQALANSNTEALCKCLETIFQYYLRSAAPAESIKGTYRMAYSLLRQYLHQQEIYPSSCEGAICKEIEESISLKMLHEQFVLLCIAAMEFAIKKQYLSYRPEIRQVLRYLNENLHRNVTLAEAAEIAHMSRKYFCLVFKSETGFGFKQYLAAKKVEMAKILLLQEGIKVSLVAKDLGFHNEEYFSIFFKKQTGYSPSDYIRKCVSD